MADSRFTGYFLNEVLWRRPAIKADRRILVIENAVRSEPQETNRWRFRAAIPELSGR
jgi:hypothetical protein